MERKISRRAFMKGCTMLAATAMAGGLAACGESRTEENSLPKIVVGSDNYPPYVYLNDDGAPTGIDVELAAEAFRRIGYHTEFEIIDWEQKTELVESGAIDCIWGSIFIEGREELYRWTGPYMMSRQVIAVNPNSTIQSFSDLAGKTVMVQTGSKPEEIFLNHLDERIPQTVKVLSTEDRSVQYAMLTCNYVDAIAAHDAVIMQYMKDCNIAFRILEEPLYITGLGVAFARNDTRGLDQQLNEVFEQMRTDGTMEQIIGKYLDNASQYLEVNLIES